VQHNDTLEMSLVCRHVSSYT